MGRSLLVLCVALCIALCVAAPAVAENPTPASAAEEPTPRADTPAPAPEPGPSPEPGPPPVPESIRDREVLLGDPYAAARPGNAPVDPEMAGFFTLPGTKTRMRLIGNAKLDLIHDFDPAGFPDAFITSTIPVGPTPSSDNTSVSIRQSRLGFDLRRPLARPQYGDLRFLFEFDFFGEDEDTVPHLRHLYGQARNLLAGYSFSTLMDPDSLPDTLDYEGPGSMVYMTQPQLRYTCVFTDASTLALALERGTSDIVTEVETDPDIVITPTSPWPDGIVRYRWEGERGHVQAGVVLRSVGGYTSTLAEAHVTAGGLSVSGAYDVRDGDTLLVQGNFGKGMGRYIEDMVGLAADVGFDEDGDLVALPVTAGFAAWQHSWNEEFRSSLVWGRIDLDSVDKTFTTQFHRSDYAAANVIWNPKDTSFDLGFEYLYGRQEIATGERGDAHRIQISIVYDLVR